MKIGITGSRKEPTQHQIGIITTLLRKISVTELHHGDCIGADNAVHDIARRMHIPITIHPPDNDKYRAFCQGATVLPPMKYLCRNRKIVDAVDKLIALPAQDTEVLRSGTWATIRYAKLIGKEIIYIYPGLK